MVLHLLLICALTLSMSIYATPLNAQDVQDVQNTQKNEHIQNSLKANDAPNVRVSTVGRRVNGALNGKPTRVESISSETIARRGATNLQDMLEWLGSGAPVSSTGTSQSMIIDGLPTSQLAILRDGLPVTRPAGSPDGPIVDLASIAIDPSTIERIDIYRGIGPPGSGRSGGVVIDIITRNTPPQASIFARGLFGGERTPSLYKQTYTLGGTLPLSPTWSIQTLGRFDALGEVDVNLDDKPDTPRRQGLYGELMASWRKSTNEFLRFGVLYTQDNTTSVASARAPLDDLVKRRNIRTRAQGRWWMHPDIRLDHNTDLAIYNNDFFKSVRSSGFERPKAQTTQLDARQTLIATWFLATHDVVFELGGGGLSVDRTGETGALSARHQLDAGFGIMDTWYVHDRLELCARAYAELHNTFGAHINAQISAAFALDPLLKLRTSISRTRRLPTAEELYLSFDHLEVGYRVTGNPDLLPEHLTSGRLGFVWTSPGRRMGFEVEGFYHHLDGIIVSTTVPKNPGLFSYANLSRAHTIGANASLQLRNLPAGLSLLGNYAFLPIAQDLNTTQRLPRRAVHSGRLELRGRWLKDKTLEAWIDLSSRSTTTTLHGLEPAPAYALLGTGLGWRFHTQARILLDVNNILDQTNATWGPTPGFNALLTLQLGYTATSH